LKMTPVSRLIRAGPSSRLLWSVGLLGRLDDVPVTTPIVSPPLKRPNYEPAFHITRIAARRNAGRPARPVAETK